MSVWLPLSFQKYKITVKFTRDWSTIGTKFFPTPEKSEAEPLSAETVKSNDLAR